MEVSSECGLRDPKGTNHCTANRVDEVSIENRGFVRLTLIQPVAVEFVSRASKIDLLGQFQTAAV